ncbi:hypothetical protein LZ30DRAFT_810071 [Colletotrichum cereale]|nr:hypothetical protein LZ30DRAFT_810071 [Colletotrichum cereale]
MVRSSVYMFTDLQRLKAMEELNASKPGCFPDSSNAKPEETQPGILFDSHSRAKSIITDKKSSNRDVSNHYFLAVFDEKGQEPLSPSWLDLSTLHDTIHHGTLRPCIKSSPAPEFEFSVQSSTQASPNHSIKPTIESTIESTREFSHDCDLRFMTEPSVEFSPGHGFEPNKPDTKYSLDHTQGSVDKPLIESKIETSFDSDAGFLTMTI